MIDKKSNYLVLYLEYVVRSSQSHLITCTCSFQVLFLKWVLTMFDMIDAKDQLRAIYGFIFSFVTNENLVFLLMTTVLFSDFYCCYLFIYCYKYEWHCPKSDQPIIVCSRTHSCVYYLLFFSVLSSATCCTFWPERKVVGHTFSSDINYREFVFCGFFERCWLFLCFSFAVRVFRIRKLVELQSKLVKTFRTSAWCWQRSPPHAQHPYFTCILVLFQIDCSASHVTTHLNLFFFREGSRFSCIFSPFTKCSFLNWWQFPFHPEWGFVHGIYIKCTFCCHGKEWIVISGFFSPPEWI